MPVPFDTKTSPNQREISLEKLRQKYNNIEQLDAILDSYSNIERNVSASPWDRIIWDPIKHQMITRTGGLVKYMMISMYDASILQPREKEKLIADFQSIFGIEYAEAEMRISNLKLV